MVARATDPELYKDKIEVSLDGRQIFYLFFGGAVVACLVFVLGVMVGRRLESRAHVDRAAATSAVRDPLAALDRLADGKGEMTFPSALAGSGGPAADVDRAIAAMAEPKEKAKEKPLDKVKVEEKASEKPVEKPVAKVNEPEKVVVKAPEKPKADAPASVPEPANKKGRFTLQLSAFQDKAEADAFLATVKSAGYAAYVTSANVDDKGTWYRVRLGTYGSYDEAVVAKADFEKKVPKIAYVTRL